MGRVTVEIQDNEVAIVINNPEKMNCLDLKMLHELDRIIQQISGNKTIRVLKIQGAGDRAFSTGANLNEFKNLDQEGLTSWVKLGNRLFNDIESLPIPTLAIINGYAIGGGFELALACDFRIATSNSQFAFPELKHGWIPGWGGLSRLRRLIGESRAKQIIMLSEMVDTKAAYDMGLIHKMCSIEELADVVNAVVYHLKDIDPFLLELTKNALREVNRNTSGKDLLFDVLASQYSKKGN